MKKEPTTGMVENAYHEGFAATSMDILLAYLLGLITLPVLIVIALLAGALTIFY